MSGVIGAPLNEPQLGDDRGGPATPLLAVNGLIKHFGVKGGFLTKAGAVVRAVDGVSFDVGKGETLGIVGESGCGKSTVARLIMQIIKPDAGELLFDGEAVGSPALDITSFRKQVQMIFQDSYASLNPRLTVEDTVAFGPRVHGMSRQQSITLAHDLLHRVGLDPGRFAGVVIDQFDFVTVAFAPAGVHPLQHFGPVLAFSAAGAGMHFEIGIVGIGFARQQRLHLVRIGTIGQCLQ